MRLPGAGEDLDPVDDEPDPEQSDENPQDRLDDQTGERQGQFLAATNGTAAILGAPRNPARATPQLWLKKPASAMRCLSAAATVTFGGDSRKTLLVTRSMLPRVAKISPAAKSTSRLASASS